MCFVLKYRNNFCLYFLAIFKIWHLFFRFNKTLSKSLLLSFTSSTSKTIKQTTPKNFVYNSNGDSETQTFQSKRNFSSSVQSLYNTMQHKYHLTLKLTACFNQFQILFHSFCVASVTRPSQC